MKAIKAEKMSRIKCCEIIVSVMCSMQNSKPPTATMQQKRAQPVIQIGRKRLSLRAFERRYKTLLHRKKNT